MAKADVNLKTLVDAAFLSKKQFTRVFSNWIGCSPKQFLKVIRFQNALFQKSQNQQLSLTELAYISGYYDQAHMVHDFQSFAGLSPSKVFKSGISYSDYFQ